MIRNIAVILRQPEDSADIANAARERGMIPLIEPILSIEYLKPSGFAASAQPVIFTSANGVRGYAALGGAKDIPVFAVGPNTAEEAARTGFSRIEQAGGTVDDLAAFIEAKGVKNAVYARGETVSKDLKVILEARAVRIDELTVYRAVPANNLSLKLLHALDRREISVILFYSRAGAETFASLIEQYDRTVRIKEIKALCISDSVVESVSVLPFRRTLIAKTPDRYGMMKLVGSISVNEE